MPSDDISRRVSGGFVPNTLVKSSEANAEFDQLVNTMNTKMGRGVNQTISGNNTFSGINSFSGVTSFSNAKADAIAENTLNAGVSIEGVLLKDGALQVTGSAGYTPSANGAIGYDTTTNQYRGFANGNVINFNSGVAAVVSVTGNVQFAAGDKGKLYDCLNLLTLSTVDPATLGDPWWVYVKNSGSGAVTIDPFSTNTIDGQSTINAYPGESYMVYKSGSNFKTFGRAKGQILLSSAIASNVTSIDFTDFINSDFDRFILTGDCVVPATDGANAYVRFSVDGGSSYLAGTSYNWRSVDTTAGTDTGTGTAQFKLNRTTIGNADGEGISFELSISKPTLTQAIKGVKWETDSRNTVGGDEGTFGTGKLTTASAINAARFLFSTGNISQGTFNLYGVRR